MRLRTIALALALACGFTVSGEASKNVVRPAAKSHKVKRSSRRRSSKKPRRVKKAKARKPETRIKHR
jgi:hypothetical protein